MKVIYEKFLGGQLRLMNVTTPAGDQGVYVKGLVGAGNPFWAWSVIPPGRVIGASFVGAPICSDDTAENNVLINSITEDPANVLEY